jgi:hypothetical protein
MNTIKRQTIIIKLLDEAGGVTMQWTLSNNLANKITSTNLNNDGNEVAIDNRDCSQEQLVISNGK